MAITRDEVRHIAKLANLEFGDDEQDRFTRQLSAILDYVKQLDRLDTSAVEPTAHIVAVDTPWRDDVVTNAPDTDALLANAPARDDDLFLVPKIID